MLSAIVPFHNSEKTLRECVEALLSQKAGEEFEIILVDDGSTDKSIEVLSGLKEPRIKVLKQERNGPAAARNYGAREARGRVVVFTDSDCVASENWLQEMVKPFEGGRIVGVQGAYKSMQKELTARFVQLEIEKRYELMKRNEFIDFIGSYSAAYDRKVFLDAGGFDEGFPIASGEDTELSYRLHGLGYKMVFNPKAVVFHKHPTSLGRYLGVKFWRAYWRVRLYSKHKGKAVKDSYTPQSLKAQIALVYLLFILLPFAQTAAAVAGILYMSLVLKESAFALKKDLAVAVVSPVVIFLRDLSFGAGLFYGKLRGVDLKRG